MWTNTNCDSETLRYEKGVSQMMTISDEGGSLDACYKVVNGFKFQFVLGSSSCFVMQIEWIYQS